MRAVVKKAVMACLSSPLITTSKLVLCHLLLNLPTAEMFVFCFIAEAALKAVFVLVTDLRAWKGQTGSYQPFNVIYGRTGDSSAWGWGDSMASKYIISLWFLSDSRNLMLSKTSHQCSKTIIVKALLIF